MRFKDRFTKLIQRWLQHKDNRAMTEQSFNIVLTVESTDVARAEVITSDGTHHQFSPLEGKQLDSFNDPEGSFVQRCIICTVATLPNFRAIYRPDVNSAREEWIFEYGDPWATAINDMGAYTAVITRNTGDKVSINVAEHYWFSRWRWQSTIRPVRFTMRDLMEAHLIPYLDATNLCLGPVNTVPAYVPMALCGIPSDQGTTGIYQGIGLITGNQAQYGTRSNVSENLFRNQAEASGTVQWHVRDTKTNGIFNWVYEYPNANMYSASVGSPFFNYTKRAKPDSGHHPSLVYVPYLLTGDPYYLEELQYTANHIPLMSPPKSRWSDRGRYFAWPLRSVAQAYLATPGAVPSWLQPKSYFNEMLKQNHAIAMKHVNDTTDPWNYVFHTMPDYGQHTIQDPVPSGDHVWQYNYTGLVLGWLVEAGLSDWRVVAEWGLRNQADRASSTSGYMRAYPSPYHIRLRNASALSIAMATTDTSIRLQYDDTFAPGEVVTIDSETMTLVSTSADRLTWTVRRGAAPKTHAVNTSVYGKKHESWPEMMESNKRTKANYWIQPPTDTLGSSQTDLTYPSNHRAALMQAINAGLIVPRLAEASQWLDAEIRKKVTSNVRVEDNWAVVKSPRIKRRIPRIANTTEDQD